MTKHVLIVDDEPGMRLGLQLVLKKEGYAVSVAGDGEQAIGMLESRPYDLVLTDLRMPKKDGFAVLSHAANLAQRPQVMMLTAYGDIPTAVQAMKLGAVDFIQKPFENSEVRARVKTVLAKRELEAELAEGGAELAEIFADFPQIVTKDPGMARVFKTVKRIAKTPCTVLVLGESGTGKELIARALHRLSDRAEKSLVATASFTESLVESDLFGHVQGSFTGALADKKGYFEAADRGTLFLDEVGDLPMSVQTKLLRVIQEGKFCRVGSSEEIRVDVRLIAATWRDLKQLIAERLFREDLYYRLNVVSIRLAPLRERPGDVPLLMDHFLSKMGAGGPQAQTLTAAALTRLRQYSWPGNIRELEHCCTRLKYFAGEVIDEADVESALEND